jgi:hypothetical protein
METLVTPETFWNTSRFNTLPDFIQQLEKEYMTYSKQGLNIQQKENFMIFKTLYYVFVTLYKENIPKREKRTVFYETISPLGWFHIRNLLVWRLSMTYNDIIFRDINKYRNQQNISDKDLIEWEKWIDVALKVCVMPYRVQNTQYMRTQTRYVNNNIGISTLSYGPNHEFYITLLGDKTGRDTILPTSIGVGKKLSYILEWFFFLRYGRSRYDTISMFTFNRNRVSAEIVQYVQDILIGFNEVGEILFPKQHLFRMMIVNTIGYITQFERSKLNMIGLITRDDIKTLEKSYSYWSRLGTYGNVQDNDHYTMKSLHFNILLDKTAKKWMIKNFGFSKILEQKEELNEEYENEKKKLKFNVCTTCGSPQTVFWYDNSTKYLKKRKFCTLCQYIQIKNTDISKQQFDHIVQYHATCEDNLVPEYLQYDGSIKRDTLPIDNHIYNTYFFNTRNDKKQEEEVEVGVDVEVEVEVEVENNKEKDKKQKKNKKKDEDEDEDEKKKKLETNQRNKYNYKQDTCFIGIDASPLCIAICLLKPKQDKPKVDHTTTVNDFFDVSYQYIVKRENAEKTAKLKNINWNMNNVKYNDCDGGESDIIDMCKHILINMIQEYNIKKYVIFLERELSPSKLRSSNQARFVQTLTSVLKCDFKSCFHTVLPSVARQHFAIQETVDIALDFVHQDWRSKKEYVWAHKNYIDVYKYTKDKKHIHVKYAVVGLYLLRYDKTHKLWNNGMTLREYMTADQDILKKDLMHPFFDIVDSFVMAYHAWKYTLYMEPLL